MQKSRPGHKFSAKQRTTDVLIDEQVDFESLLLSPPLVKGLTDSGFEKPSPIQLKAIPLGRCGLDLIAQAKSGTGKTCVFSVIALETINTDSNASQVLILAPTREIAVQIKDVITAIGCHIKGLSCQVFIGGMPLEDDKKALKGCHIVVGSPGRVKYLIENNHLKTDSIRMFILDEADKLLDDSFQEQINWIYSTLPSNKQMMAFSATYPEYLANHLTRYMREPTFVRLNAADPTLQGIKQFYCTVPFHHLPHKVFQEKVDRLLELLSKVNFHQCLLFSNYQIRAQSLSSTLCSKGWPATFIAGNQSQQKRLQAMEKLKDFKCRILISTDLTARGIDAENVNLVVNMDIPRDGETYLHRIGRAGRFGTKGIAVTFVAKGKEQKDLKELEKSIGIILQPLPESIPESFMVSMSPSNPSQLEKDVIEVNILHNKPNKSSKTDQTKHESQTEDSSIDNVPLPDGDVNCNADNVEEELFGIMRSAQTTQDGIVNEECKILAPVDTSCSKEHENDFISSVCSDSSIIQSLQVRNIDQNSTTTNKFANKLPKCTRDKAYINDSVAKTEKGSTVILSAESSADVMCNAPLGKVSVASNDVDLKCASSIPSKQILPSAQEFDKDFEDYLASLSCKPLNNLQKCDSEKKEDLEDLKFGMLPSAQEFDQDFEDYLSLTNKPQNSLQNCDNTLKTETDNVSLAMLASVQEFDQDFEEYLALTDELHNCEQIYENYPDINENVTLGCHKKVKGSIDSSEEYGDIGVDGCRKSSRNNDGGDDGGGDSDVDGGVSGDEDDGGVCDVDDSGNDDGGDSDDYSGVSDADDDSDDDDKSCHSDIVAVMGSLILKANDSDNRVTNYDKNDHDNNGGASSNVDDDDNVDSDADGSSSNDDVDDNDVDNSDDDSDSISAIDADDIDDTDDGKDDGDESDGDVSCGSHICSKILDGISSADDLLCAKNDSKTQYQGSGNSKSNGDVQQQQQFNQKQTINHPDKCKKEEKYIHKQQTGGGDKSCYYGNRASNQWSIGNHGDDMLRPSAFQSNDGYQAEVDEMNYYGNTEHPTHYYENSLENQSRYGSYYDRPWANTHYYGNTDINTQLSNHSNSDYQTHQPKHQTYQRWEAGASYHGNHVNSQCCYGNTDYSTYGNQHYDSYPSGETDMSFHGNADVASKSCKCHLNSHQRVGHGSTSRTASGGVDLEWQGIWNNAFHTINNMIVQFGRQHTK